MVLGEGKKGRREGEGKGNRKRVSGETNKKTGVKMESNDSKETRG